MAENITNPETTYGRIRLLIGDTKQGNGILPGNINFLDAELQAFYDIEDDGAGDIAKNTGRAAAAALEAAATQWASAPYEEMVGPHRMKMRASEFLNKRAEQLRRRYGNVLEPKSYQGRLSIKRAVEYP